MRVRNVGEIGDGRIGRRIGFDFLVPLRLEGRRATTIDEVWEDRMVSRGHVEW